LGGVAPVGIERIGVWPGTLCLPMEALCAARGVDVSSIRNDMLIDERSVSPLWEDPVTMAVNAAETILTPEDRRDIELLIVASESGVDYEKPMSTWVHRYLDLTPHCRNFEIKHACYGGTAGLQMAVNWLTASARPGAKALLICTDQSRTHLGKPWEFVLGASAAAILISRDPSIAEVEVGKSGYWTYEVSDLTRPTGRVETGNSETSLISYLEALEGAFEHFVARVPEAADYDRAFAWHVYHAPFGGMTLRAHTTLMRRYGLDRREARAHFCRKTLPSLAYVRRIGGTYSASTFIELLAISERGPGLHPGDRISMFSYGSGSCAEFYCLRCGQAAQAVASESRVTMLLDARDEVSVEQYESIETTRSELVDRGDYDIDAGLLPEHFDRRYRGRRRLIFTGMRDYYRQYAWS
jgi:hydroxymethylglutaryl-CoA synthase